MNHLVRLLVTISFNLAVLTTTAGWLVAQHRVAFARGTIASREYSINVDTEAWFFESGIYPFR